MATKDGAPSPNSTPVSLSDRDIAVNALQMGMAQGTTGLDHVPGLVKRVIRENGWQERRVHQTREVARFATFMDFLQAQFPEGLNSSVSALKRLCANDPEALDLLDQVTVGTHGGDHRGNLDNIQLDKNRGTQGPRYPSGTSAQRALRVLRAKRPDLHAQVLAKTMKPHAAMKQAGFVKVPTVLELLQKQWQKATPEERAEFQQWITEHTNDE